MSHTSTKSIDVGSMFLMDLSVHESDPFNEQGNPLTVENDSVYPVGLTYQRQANENRSNYANQSTLSTTNTTLTSIVHHRRDNQQKKKQQQREYLGNSLDSLACAIDDGGQYKTAIDGKQSSFVTIVEPQPPPELLEHQSSSSLSDDSYVASEGTNSLSASSFSASSNAEGDDRGSTTTREDSGVLDIKDLDSQLNNSYYNEHEERFCQPLHHHQQQKQQLSKQRLLQEKPISNSTKATNLINKSVDNYNRDGSYVTTSHPEQPTNDNNNSSSGSSSSNNNHQHHNHHHQNYRSQSKRLVSASLPIQVPVRQMKKDLKKSKLNMIIKNSTAATTSIKIDEQLEQPQQPDIDLSSVAKRTSYNHHCSAAMPAGVDDFEEFLEQEYNENHHNHYPIDEYDDEHLRAEENPMKLFESIQALARSLHEDTELFGSLPPKRMLESPIRPLAFV